MMRTRGIAILSLAIFIGVLSMFGRHTQKPCLEPANKHPLWINVFVHGVVQPSVNPRDIVCYLKDEVEGTFNSRLVDEIRNDEFFHKTQPVQYNGLQKIENFDTQTMNSLLSKLYTIQTPFIHNECYTFGWSGYMSVKWRAKAGNELYYALQKEVDWYRTMGYEPKIRLIGYSHGGNVLLNMGRAYEESKAKQVPFRVDELVLIGMPVQNDTACYIHSPLFKHVYHLYSGKDRAQQLDIFSKAGGLSGKTFKYNLEKCPTKLTQVEIRVTRNTHGCIQRCKDTDPRYNFADPNILIGNAFGLRDHSPGHIELWFLGWNTQYFRKDFPLYPLPISAFIPFITTSINNAHIAVPPRTPLVFDIRPDQDTVILRPKKSTVCRDVIPFLNKTIRTEMYELAQQYPLTDYTPCAIEKHLEKLTQQVKKEWKAAKS